jgi:hypothetical protein
MSNAPLVPLTGTPGNAAPLPLIDEMDLSIQCNPAFLRSTVSKIVNSQAAATNSRLPLGLVCKPMAGDVGTDNDGECLAGLVGPCACFCACRTRTALMELPRAVGHCLGGCQFSCAVF